MNDQLNKHPSVAVLLASFNGMEWIKPQIISINQQTGVTVKLILSDDGSTDGTQQWLQQNQAYFEYRLLPNKRSGSAAANFFRLIRETDFSDYDYVALSDQDDIWFPDKLARAVESLEASGCAGYSSNVMAFWPDGRRQLIEKSQPQTKYDYFFESAGPGCSFVLTKDLALSFQHFLIQNESSCQSLYYHDWFIYAYARTHRYKWFIDHKARMDYRQHSDNMVGVNTGLKAYKARFEQLRSGNFLSQSLLTGKLLGNPEPWLYNRIYRFNLFDRLCLICHSFSFRRRLRDKIGLAIAFIFIKRKELYSKVLEIQHLFN